MRDLTTATKDIVIHFRDLFRSAREAAQKDAENFDAVIFALEKLGSYLHEGSRGGLKKYSKEITKIAQRSPLANLDDKHRDFHTPFALLFELVCDARNDAMHEGAYARHLTQHAIEIVIIMEDALNQIIAMKPTISEMMVRDVVCAEMWQPLSFLRQSMLQNSFTCLPVFDEQEGQWKLVYDLAVAAYTQCAGYEQRKNRLALALKDAIEGKPPFPKLELRDAITITGHTKIEIAVQKISGKEYPAVLLVVDANDESRLLGIVMPFDLL